MKSGMQPSCSSLGMPSSKTAVHHRHANEPAEGLGETVVVPAGPRLHYLRQMSAFGIAYALPMRFGKKSQDSLFDADKVDVVAESADGLIELVIVQDQPWTGSDSQLSSLQAKVQTYVSFALDGGLSQQFPEAAGRPWCIVINCLTGQPDNRTASVLDVLATRLPEHGGSLLVRTA
jgi:hypothetical protein